MDGRSLYDEDVYAWAQQQADALRRLAHCRQNLPNELDLENVAEEIEDVGSSRRDAAESFIRLILVHLIKLSAAPGSSPAKHWRREIVSFHNELLSKLTPSMWARIDVDLLWARAIKEARAGLEAEEVSGFDPNLLERLRTCPLGLSLLAREDFEIEAAVEQIRDLLR